MNPTGSKGVMEVFKELGITTPTINLPGCATHPDWFIGTVAAMLLGGPESIKVDDKGLSSIKSEWIPFYVRKKNDY